MDVSNISRYFLIITGVLYAYLAIWCVVQPEKTAKAVGFQLIPGSGQSEYLTVYGGMVLSVGLMFLWPLVRPEEQLAALKACFVVHVCLVAFRTAGFLMYTGIGSTTYSLAIGEWVIFLVSLVLLVLQR